MRKQFLVVAYNKSGFNTDGFEIAPPEPRIGQRRDREILATTAEDSLTMLVRDYGGQFVSQNVFSFQSQAHAEEFVQQDSIKRPNYTWVIYEPIAMFEIPQSSPIRKTWSPNGELK